MTEARSLLEKVSQELRSGSARLAHLGSRPTAEELRLESPEAMARYADLVRPDVALALKNNRKLEWVVITCLILLFVVATFLALFAQLKNWGWSTRLMTIPGLGVAAYWPVNVLLRIRRENLILIILPQLLPLLSRKDLSQLLDRLLPRSQ